MSFLSKEQQTQISDSISLAEKNTSGEVVLYICKKCKKDIYHYAQEIFNKKGLYKTAQRNAVLIMLSYQDHKLAVIGDEGINTIVEGDFWDDVIKHMTDNFKNNAYTEGLSEGINMIGEKLKVHFPYQSDDVNELPNEIIHED
ncbi:TPM domain-containing protein [Lentisphaera profundi]|uniref:TPM domain-containing protein n=1 Tax=Lentisphaera profundi TaxID=1658616 RepID=A0ABY7VZH5_9BACT|nr:TPM domain-containing protein [Lentisphaera profundi]WDE99199.1 TPM domain-containing protein [Lentisphaera profundi]